MCHEQTLVPIPDWATRGLETFDATHPEFGVDEQGRRCFAIDSCIVPALLAVWAAGFKTLGCCCGHDSGHGVISIDLGWENQAGVLNPWLLEHHCVMCGVLHGEKEGEPLPEWASDAPKYAPSELSNYATSLTLAEEQVKRLTVERQQVTNDRQNDLRILLQALGMFDGAQSRTPQSVFKEAIANARQLREQVERLTEELRAKLAAVPRSSDQP